MMLPFCSQSSAELQNLKRPNTVELIKNSFNSVKAHIYLHPRIWLVVTIFFIQILLVLMTCAPPLSLSIRHLSTPPSAEESEDGECGYGRVYVYDLPAMFNRELVANCTDLDPWNWQCGVVMNGGLGRIATEIAGIVPENLAPAWHRTNQFSSEVIFHNRLLNYKCRTIEPESATAYYIPFYAGLAVGKYLWRQSVEERDWHCEMLLMWVQNQTYWRRSNGSDHFIVLGRITWDFRRLTDPEQLWGSSFLNMPPMQNVTRLTIERAPGDYYDVGVPYPTGFHPRSDSDVGRWQSFVRTLKRNRLFSFVGATRGGIKNDFRGLLLSECRNESDSCRLVDCSRTRCSNGSTAALEAFLDSDFCLQPRGDSFTRRSVFDCMVAGSIPVFFWARTAYDQYEWFLPGEPESYSVLIDHNDVRNGTNVKGVLDKYGREEVKRMREKVIESIPKIVYAKPNKGLESTKDAFEVAIDGVLRRFMEQREGRIVPAQRKRMN